MKICFISKTLDLSTGYGHFAYDLINNLRKKHNIGISILVERGENILLDEKAVLIKERRLGFILNPFILIGACRDADIIHVLDGYPYGIFAIFANIFLRKKLVITMQGTYAVEPLYMKGRSFLLKYAYKKADYLTAISSFTKNEVEKVVTGLKRIKVINHGVDFNKYQEQISKIKERIIPQRYILSVGAIIRRKGYHISIAAFSKIKEKFPDLKYIIVGSVSSNNYLNEIKKIIWKSGLKQDDIVFLNGLNDEYLANLYYYAEVFLLPSINVGHHFEGFGLVFLEAGAFGIPVIGAFGSGAEDAIKNNITGILVPQNNVEAVVSALMKILSDKFLQGEMGRNGFELAELNDWSRIVYKYEEVYKELC